MTQEDYSHIRAFRKVTADNYLNFFKRENSYYFLTTNKECIKVTNKNSHFQNFINEFTGINLGNDEYVEVLVPDFDYILASLSVALEGEDSDLHFAENFVNMFMAQNPNQETIQYFENAQLISEYNQDDSQIFWSSIFTLGENNIENYLFGKCIIALLNAELPNFNKELFFNYLYISMIREKLFTPFENGICEEINFEDDKETFIVYSIDDLEFKQLKPVELN